MKIIVRLHTSMLLVALLLIACSREAPSAEVPTEELISTEEVAQSELEENVESEEPAEPQTGKPVAKDMVEIFSWWTTGGEGGSLDSLIEVFEAQHPGVKVVNAVAAVGIGSDAKVELFSRMQEGNPPDSVQVRAGHQLIDSWVAAGSMEPVTFIFEENGWDDVYPAGVIGILSYDDEIWSVPVNIQRSNVLWYNKAIFDKFGLEPPASLDEFFETAETLQAQGVPPLAIADKSMWASMHLFENVLLGTLGPDGYRGLWMGETSWGSTEVTQALYDYEHMIDFAKGNRSVLSWQQAAQQVADGEAAMIIMGDWVNAYYLSLGLTQGVEIGWVPSPGTSGSFMMFSDSFSLPAGAHHRDNAVAWLTVVGSWEGQDAFNQLYGSIPARTDGDRSLYGVYQQSAMDDYANDEIVPSVALGAAASDGWVAALNDVMTIFIEDLDVQAAQQRLIQACEDSGACGGE